MDENFRLRIPSADPPDRWVLGAYALGWRLSWFRPLIGVGVAVEELRFSEWHENEWRAKASKIAVGPDFILGWDIRPTEREWFYLRTIIRMAVRPSVRPKAVGDNILSGGSVAFSQLEFNLIQFVVFPGRLAREIRWQRRERKRSLDEHR